MTEKGIMNFMHHGWPGHDRHEYLLFQRQRPKGAPSVEWALCRFMKSFLHPIVIESHWSTASGEGNLCHCYTSHHPKADRIGKWYFQQSWWRLGIMPCRSEARFTRRINMPQMSIHWWFCSSTAGIWGPGIRDMKNSATSYQSLCSSKLGVYFLSQDPYASLA